MRKEELADLITTLLSSPGERTQVVEQALTLPDEAHVVAVELKDGTEFFVEVNET